MRNWWIYSAVGVIYADNKQQLINRGFTESQIETHPAGKLSEKTQWPEFYSVSKLFSPESFDNERQQEDAARAWTRKHGKNLETAIDYASLGYEMVRD